MNIHEMKVGDVLAIAAALQGTGKPCGGTAFWKVGKKYFIRTVTHHHTGELVAVTDQEIILKDAAWIADDGRLTDALRKGEFNEVEMFPTGTVLVGRGSIIDAVEISTIPVSQK